MEKKPKTQRKASKGVSIELDLPVYWRIRDIQRAIEEETGIKKTIASICEQLVAESLERRK
jgi:predicted GIY-YIG superfamily endonuclease